MSPQRSAGGAEILTREAFARKAGAERRQRRLLGALGSHVPVVAPLRQTASRDSCLRVCMGLPSKR